MERDREEEEKVEKEVAVVAVVAGVVELGLAATSSGGRRLMSHKERSRHAWGESRRMM